MQISHAQIIESLGGVTSVANRLGIKPPSVSEWIAADKEGVPRDGIPAGRLIELGAEIEVSTKGQWTRKNIRPYDWHLIWPELAQPWDGTERRQPGAADESTPAADGAQQGAQQQGA